MSGIIHFSSGKTLEIEEVEFRNMPVTLNSKGIKTKKTKAGHLVPMNSYTMEYIEHVPEKLDTEINPEIVTKPMEHGEAAILKPMPKEIDRMDKQEAKPQKTQEEILAEMMEKSNCKHEPDKLELYIQHTAKGIRYFPVCSFCGKREKYVSERKIVDKAYVGTPNEKWTEEDLANAKPWNEV